MIFTSTGGEKEKPTKVPYFEDARANETRYYSSTKSPDRAIAEVRHELQELGAYSIEFSEGYFGTGKQKRYGYLVVFGWNGTKGKIPLAGLPLKNEPFNLKTRQKKIVRIRVQALLILRDQLINYRQSPIFLVDSMPMLQHILVDGEHTLIEYLQQFGMLPALPAGERGETVEGEFSIERPAG